LLLREGVLVLEGASLHTLEKGGLPVHLSQEEVNQVVDRCNQLVLRSTGYFHSHYSTVLVYAEVLIPFLLIVKDLFQVFQFETFTFIIILEPPLHRIRLGVFNVQSVHDALHHVDSPLFILGIHVRLLQMLVKLLKTLLLH
jgi:hypothetical protein